MKKSLLILLTSFILIFSFSSAAFASTGYSYKEFSAPALPSTFVDEGVTYNTADFPYQAAMLSYFPKNAIHANFKGCCYVLVSTSPLDAIPYVSSDPSFKNAYKLGFGTVTGSKTYGFTYRTDILPNQWVLETSPRHNNNFSNSPVHTYYTTQDGVEYVAADSFVLSSTHDILYRDRNEVFFSAPRLTYPQEAAVVMGEEFPQLLKIILPVGLVVLSLLLAIYLIKRLLRSFL